MNIRDPDGMTALHLAVYYDLFSVVEILIEAGADINVAAKYDCLPNHWPRIYHIEHFAEIKVM